MASGIFTRHIRSRNMMPGDLHASGKGFLMTAFADWDLFGTTIQSAANDLISYYSAEDVIRVLADLHEELNGISHSWLEIGYQTNRHFEDEAQARQWLEELIVAIEGAVNEKPPKGHN